MNNEEEDDERKNKNTFNNHLETFSQQQIGDPTQKIINLED